MRANTILEFHSNKTRKMKINHCLLLIGFAFTTNAFCVSLSAHEWTDKTGHYRVEAELVSANHELVVLRTIDHRLIALDMDQLSEADQVFVRSKIERSSKGIGGVEIPAPLVPVKEQTKSEKSVATSDPEKITVATPALSIPSERSESTAGGWHLIDGQRIQGEFMGFDLKPLSIKRASSDVYVGGVLFSQLDPVYQHILPMTIAHLENAKIEDVRDIEKWLIKSGPGPWTYKIEAVLIETPNRGSVAIPTFLLDKSVSDAISVPLRRWREAIASQESEEDRNKYFDRERFLTRASMTAQTADPDVERQARYMRLELLAVASGVTDLWNVTLLPNSGFSYPYHVLVPGQNSDEARVTALQRFPNFTVGGIAKHTR